MSELEPTLTNSHLTTTEILRRLLDERGVEWWEGDDERKTYWCFNGLTWEYFNDENGDAWLGFLGACENDVTPEQAIAATLGPAYEPPMAMHWDGDTLTLTIPRDPSCIRVRRSAEQPYKVYADESKVIAATLGSCNCSNNCTNSERTETCHDEGDPSDFCCSECGVRMFIDTSDTYTMIASDGRTIIKHPNYCPNCGRRVEQ